MATTTRLTVRDIYGPDVDVEALRAKYDAERDRRIRPDGKRQYSGVSGAFASYGDDPNVAGNFQRDPIVAYNEVVIVGGGFAGLLAGARLKQAGYNDVRIIEHAGDFGGTWYWNRYPGAQCDIEALIYLPLLEEVGYTPRDRYAYQPEIYQHCRNIGHHFGLYEHATFQTSITSMHWNEERREWAIETDRDDKLTAKYVVLACGRQSLPKLPNLPGIERFKGAIFHSSRWRYDYTGGDATGNLTGLKDKRVGVIGTGASGVQIVPHVAACAKETFVFQRTPSSIGVRANRKIEPDYTAKLAPGWQRERMENFAASMAGERPAQDLVQDSWTAVAERLFAVKRDVVAEQLGHEPSSDEMALATELLDHSVMNDLRQRIADIVEDPDKALKLTPWYRWQCKRPCYNDEYLAAFNRHNVHLVDACKHGLQSFTENTVVVEGQSYELDCLIFATGFEAGVSFTHLAGFEIYGRDGRELSEHWGEGPRSLFGQMTDGFPNLFFMGAGTPSAAAINVMHLLDEQSRQLAYILSTARDRGSDMIEVEAAAVEDYTSGIRNSPKNKALFAFFSQCTPGYYNLEGSAKRAEEFFLGGKYGDGPRAFFEMLAAWREKGDMAGFRLS